MTDILLENVSYEYPNRFRALNKISWVVERGQFVVIMGPNGAGKSTLCLALNGIIPQSIGGTLYGAIHINGMDTMEHETYKLAQLVGLVMQNPEAQLLCSAVEDELAFGPENLCVSIEEIKERIHRNARAVRIEDLLDRGPADLSGGQIQRVITAAMLTMEPRIMVFDEATSALDPRGATELFQLARELNQEQHMTVVMTEHKSEQIAEFADYIVILDRGEIVDIGTPKEVFSRVDKLREIKVAPPQVTRLMHALGFPPEELPITIDEAEEMLRSHLPAQDDFDGEDNIDQFREHANPSVETAKEPIIEAQGLSFSYPGDIEALKDITLTINKGDFVGIIGENGAGKTTLVKHFVGLLRSSQGKLTVFGQSNEKLTTSTLAGQIGLVLQNPDHQLFKSSVVEEVQVGPIRFGLKGDELEKRVSEAMGLVGITEIADKHPLSLSWGDRQRVALASILALKPEVIIFDEPTTGQDLEGRTVFMELAKNLNEQGFTIIVITHDMELITRYVKRCIVMEHGRILMDDTTREVFQHPDILRETFIEVPQIVQLAQRLTDCGIPSNILTVEEMVKILSGKRVRP